MDEGRAVDPDATMNRRVRAHLVHLYTAIGIGFAFLAAMETCGPDPDPRRVFVWLTVAVLIDASDGPLARAWKVKRYAPKIDGRTIDDIVDYITFTFLPLLLVWRMGWLPWPAMAPIIPALVASLFGFANTGAKQEGEGFFLGFPSYWNIYAFYAGLWYRLYGPIVPLIVIVGQTLLTVLPVRFLYPNLAPRPWWVPVWGGAFVWLALLLWMLWDYPNHSATLVWISLVYPIFYTVLSIGLDLQARRRRAVDLPDVSR